jgi:hypothetical protein
MVTEELLRIVSQVESSELMRFSALRARVEDVSSNSLRKLQKPANKYIDSLIECEL